MLVFCKLIPFWGLQIALILLEITLHIPQTIAHILQIALTILEITLHIPPTIVYILQTALNILEIALFLFLENIPQTVWPH